jgi:23S rRNA (guanosine2251-2'-O)-methyltransferase
MAGRDREWDRKRERSQDRGSRGQEQDRRRFEQDEQDAGEQEEWIAGKHPVMEALRAGREINKIWVADGGNRNVTQPIIAEAKKLGIVVQFVDKRKLDQMVHDIPHQGVVAQAAAYRYFEVEELIAAAEAKGEEPFLLILDEIEDPHNLGSILRTAECTGVHGVIIPKRRSAGLTPTVSKTSAGAVEYVPVARVTNIAQTIDKLKERGIWVAGTDVNDAEEVYRANFNLPLAIVIGNEGKGIGRLIREKCDFLVKLPMHGRLNSLNASVAAGVLMYEAVRQRLQASRAATAADGPSIGRNG